MPKHALVPIIVENDDGPKPELHSVLKPSPPPEPLPPPRQLPGVDTAADAVRGAVGAASTVASTAVSAAATTVGFLTKLPMIGEQSGGKTPSEESSKSAAGDHSPPSPSDSEHSTTKTSSLTAAREKRKWESLRAVGNPMIQTVCFVLTMLAGLLMIALLAYMLLGTQDKSKSAAAQVHRPTVTADPDDITPWFPLPPTDNPNGTGSE